ncbi:hypothetical protein HS088_TW15G00205 [Tripterygium wilfordii]|uniref:SHSP domain-containing protein n=1 Tax=Tripterygium wilfordii TaxID=458696 RepID=A0A7J7CKW9_TRIWF|nr:inactive protein RESTRICTED TEV MOVEMENT 2-like [Tripterygium wilfordii]KAF5734713.1 hypothetical protein HS088_TW15G00205 [Tripterygium wilfordii]
MADAQKRGEFRERERSHNSLVEQIVPSSAWTEDSYCHYLLVDIPGFKKEEVKLHIDDSGNVIVSGERLVKDDKFIIFEQTFKIPDNSDADQISGKFDGEILHVTVPKKPIKKHEEEPRTANVEAKNAQKHGKDGQVDKDHHQQQEQVKEKKAKKVDHHFKDGFPKEIIEKWGLEDGSELVAVAMEMVKKHKGIVITAALAFSLGCFVGRKFQ